MGARCLSGRRLVLLTRMAIVLVGGLVVVVRCAQIRSLRSAVQANDDLARRVLRGDITAAQLGE